MITVGGGWARTCTGWTRRDFLKASTLGACGLAASGGGPASARPSTSDRSVILILLVGGPSQLETWDPKPAAPAEIRGPFGTTPTALPGVRISEHLPRLARRMDRLALVRSLHHDAAPIHETGLQLIQTGSLCPNGDDHPHIGAVAGKLRGSKHGLPPFVVVPGAIGDTGVAIAQGQTAGPCGPAFDPFRIEADPAAADYHPGAILDRMKRFLDQPVNGSAVRPEGAGPLLTRSACRAFHLDHERPADRDRYGRSTFGQSLLLARRLVEAGVRCVTVNMFDTVFHRTTWDCHGSRPFSTLDDYARELLPTFDRALAALLDDLGGRGLLDSTLVAATGEFGRTPRLNAAGGRDHWPGAWSAVLAGGGIAGGQVLGRTDHHAAYPADRPVTPAELVATIGRALGIDPAETRALGLATADAPHIHELLC